MAARRSPGTPRREQPVLEQYLVGRLGQLIVHRQLLNPVLGPKVQDTGSGTSTREKISTSCWSGHSLAQKSRGLSDLSLRSSKYGR